MRRDLLTVYPNNSKGIAISKKLKQFACVILERTAVANGGMWEVLSRLNLSAFHFRRVANSDHAASLGARFELPEVIDNLHLGLRLVVTMPCAGGSELQFRVPCGNRAANLSDHFLSDGAMPEDRRLAAGRIDNGALEADSCWVATNDRIDPSIEIR